MDLAEARADLEQRHPWEQARVAALEKVLRRAGGSIRSILDYGCGDLYTGRTLFERLHADSLVGVDIQLTPELCARYRDGDPRVELHTDPRALGKRRFDLVLLCDVIEHTEDDTAVIEAVKEHLRPEGLMVVTVPAFQLLFTEQDRALKHFRRYTLGQLHERLRGAGFVLLASGYLFGSLIFVRAAEKLLERVRGRSTRHGIGTWRGGPLLTALIVFYFRIEHALFLTLSRVGVKVPGLTAWAICKKT